MKCIILCNRADTNSKLYPSDGELYLADKRVISELKKIYSDCEVMLFEDVNISKISADLVFNFADYFPDARKEAEIPFALKENGISYTGNDGEAIVICGDKLHLYSTLKENGIPILQTNADNPSFPLIIKKRFSHGSNGLTEDSIISSEEDIKKIKIGDDAVIQSFLEGREFFISLIGNEEPIALPILQVDFSANAAGIQSYKAKWSSRSIAYKGTNTKLAVLDECKRKELEEIGKKAFNALKCRGYVSIDVREDNNGNHFVIDVNPNPYIAPDADIVKAAGFAGISYPELLQIIAKLGMERAVSIGIKEKCGEHQRRGEERIER
ncbi:ATP-grasp domain-containing protein [archaeon]|nr:ATP-grasp domain-containing protein [archaeon]